MEKLQAAQQLTATLLPLSTVNVMSHEDDRCFQCHESGHTVHHCTNICCFKCNEYALIGYHPQAHLHIITEKDPTPDITLDHPLNTATRTGTDIADQGHSHILTYIEVIISITCTEVIPDLTIDATIGILHNTLTPALTIIAVTHHMADHPHIGVLWHTQETTADTNHNLHIDPVRKHNIKLHLDIAVPQQNLRVEGIPESQ